LYQDKAPKSVENFLQYAKDGFFNGTVFHRVIPGLHDPGRRLHPRHEAEGDPCPDPERSQERPEERTGTLAMARTGDPHSATAQFFINLKDNAFLDYPSRDGWGYAVFGKVCRVSMSCRRSPGCRPATPDRTRTCRTRRSSSKSVKLLPAKK
jgi:cyclophilin family peptidyl-prolyl cis-trans isomerase